MEYVIPITLIVKVLTRIDHANEINTAVDKLALDPIETVIANIFPHDRQ